MTLPKTNNTNTNQTIRLSVQIALTGLSFFVTDETNSVIDYHVYPFEFPIAPEDLHWQLEKALAAQREWVDSPTSLTVVHASNLYTVVPASLFEEGRASDYLKFNTKILANDYVGFDRIDALGMVIVYVPFINANNYLFEKFGSFDYYHATTLLLMHLLPKYKYEIKPKVFLNIQSGYFDCVVLKNGKLELCNSYSYKTPEDFIYFVLFAYEQLGLNPNEVETITCGDIDLGSPFYELLYTYVRDVHFYESNLPNLPQLKPHQEIILKTTL